MAATDYAPPELFMYGPHEYLVYEVADHAEMPPRSIRVRLERHGQSRFSIYCTSIFVRGELAQVKTPGIKQVDSEEERTMIRLLPGAPELQGFVRDWIEYCYHRREAHAEG